MAKRRKAVRRSYTARARRGISRATGGKFGPAIAGVVGGLAAQVGSALLPGYGGPLGLGATGYFMNNPTLLTIAGMQASTLIPIGGIISGMGGSGNGSGVI